MIEIDREEIEMFITEHVCDEWCVYSFEWEEPHHIPALAFLRWEEKAGNQKDVYHMEFFFDNNGDLKEIETKPIYFSFNDAPNNMDYFLEYIQEECVRMQKAFNSMIGRIARHAERSIYQFDIEEPWSLEEIEKLGRKLFSKVWRGGAVDVEGISYNLSPMREVFFGRFLDYLSSERDEINGQPEQLTVSREKSK